MGKETILLAQNWNEKKFVEGSYISEKFDGVPVRINSEGAVSRQGERIRSVDHLIPELRAIGTPKHVDLVGELWIPNKDFAYIGGKVRGHDNCSDLYLMVYDVVNNNKPLWDYAQRIKPFLEYNPMDWDNSRIHSVYTTNLGQMKASGCPVDASGVASVIKAIRGHPTIEGCIIRSPNHLFEAGKRSWGLMRWKQADTVDLKIEGFEEAIDKYGNPTGMLGSFLVTYKGHPCKVGAGKLKHIQRTDVQENQNEYIGKTIEVLYKPDPTYKGLREPTFQRFRPDKD